jgi:predicted ester cyclase
VSGTKEPLNADAWAAFVSAFPVVFPDAQISVDASVAGRDIVASRWTLTGTHRGEFQGVPPTGKAMTMVGIDPRFRRGVES